jgi:hypothetical protein
MRRFTPLLAGLLLGLTLAACGESKLPLDPPVDAGTPEPLTPADPPPPPAAAATGLGYTDPQSTGWRLVRDDSSTSTRLVLNLVGPAGLMTRGAGFNLQAPASVRFGKFTETGSRVTDDLPVKQGGVYELLNTAPVGTPHPLEPMLLAGGVKRGNLLTAGIFQKDRRASAKDSGATLLQIAVEFDAAAGLHVGDALPLSITKSKYLPEDIGAFSGTTTYEQITKSKLVDMSIALGALRAN